MVLYIHKHIHAVVHTFEGILILIAALGIAIVADVLKIITLKPMLRLIAIGGPIAVTGTSTSSKVYHRLTEGRSLRRAFASFVPSNLPVTLV